MAQDNGKLKWSSLIMGTLLLIVAVIISVILLKISTHLLGLLAYLFLLMV